MKKSGYFKMVFLGLTLLIFFSNNAFAQDKSILSGKVTFEESGKPIQNVDVRFTGMEIGVKTSADGTFSIEKNETDQILIFSHQDCDPKEINTEGLTGALNVTLASNVRYNQYGQKVSRQDLSSESREGFIVFESDDKNYKLWLDNRVYLDGAHYFDNWDADKTLEENQAEGRIDVPGQLLKLRRMRFAIKANVGDNWYGEIDFDFDGNMVDIKDVYLRRYFGEPGAYWGNLKIGQFRMPQGMQRTTTSRYLKLIERASVAEFVPNRRIGIGWSSWSKKYMFAAGVHTEETRNQHDQLEGDANYFKGSFDEPLPSNEGLMQGAEPMKGFSTRLAYYVFNKPGRLLSLSGGYSIYTPGLYKHPDKRIKYDPKDETYVSEMEFTVVKVGGVKTASNYNLDLAVSYGPWRMSGEYHYNTLAMANGTDPINFSGFYIQSAYLLTGEHHAWNHREAEFTQVRGNRKSGAWEIAARYSYINLNDVDRFVTGGQKGQFTVGLTYYTSRNVKFMLNYSYIDHDKYSNGSGDYAAVINDNPDLGPTDGFDYGFLAWRCEIDF